MFYYRVRGLEQQQLKCSDTEFEVRAVSSFTFQRRIMNIRDVVQTEGMTVAAHALESASATSEGSPSGA
jgi:hypothetical protein